MSNSTIVVEKNTYDTNTILLIMDLVFTTVSTTILGMRCKIWKNSRGFMASFRPTNSTPSPGSASGGSPKELRQVVVDDKGQH